MITDLAIEAVEDATTDVEDWRAGKIDRWTLLLDPPTKRLGHDVEQYLLLYYASRQALIAQDRWS